MLARDLDEPLPPFSDDDVLDFMVREAVLIAAEQEEIRRGEKRKRDEWKKKPLGSGGAGRRVG